MGELRRRAVHVLGSLVPGTYVLAGPRGADLIGWHHVQAFLVAGTAVAFALEALRLSGRVDWAIYGQLTREYEQEHLAGYAIYAVGMTAAALLFEPSIAVAAMLMLAVGDPISGVLSTGTVAKQAWVLGVMFVVCLGLAWPFVTPVAATAGAAVAAVADGVKPVVSGYVIDDNLTIPIGAGTAMAVVAAV